MKFLKKTNLKQQKTDQWLPGTRSGSKSWLQKKKDQEIFSVMEIFQNSIVVIITQNCKFTLKIIKLYITMWIS